MLTLTIVCLCVGAALILAAVLLALRYRRRGGAKINSRAFFVVIMLSSMGTAIMVGPPLSMLLSSR